MTEHLSPDSPDYEGTGAAPPTSALDRCPRLVGESLRHAPMARHLVLHRRHRAPCLRRRRVRREPQGRVRDPRLGHAEGDRPDRVGVRVGAGWCPQSRVRGAGGPAARHARAPEAIEAAIAIQTAEFEPTGTDPDGEAGITSVGDPFDENTFSDDGRIAYAEAQFDRIIYEEDRERVIAVQDAVRETVEPASRSSSTATPSSRRSSRGRQLKPSSRGADRAPRRLPHVHGRRDPDLPRDHGRRQRHAAVHLASFTDINTVTPLLVSMIGLGVGIDYSLFIVTRFRQHLHEGLSPIDAAAEAGASAGRAVLSSRGSRWRSR